mgnify:CR=1 FL=1
MSVPHPYSDVLPGLRQQSLDRREVSQPHSNAVSHFNALQSQGKAPRETTRQPSENGNMFREGVIYSEKEIAEARKKQQMVSENEDSDNGRECSIEQVKEMVRQWMKYDDEILLLQQGIRDRRKNRDALHRKIIQFMKHNEIPHFNLNDGQLVCQERVRKESLSRVFIQKCLGKWYSGDNNKVSQMYDFLQQNRESKSVFRLKRAKKK